MKLKILPIDELILSALRGSRSHLNLLIKIHEPIILKQLRAKIWQSDDIDDLLQKVNLSIFEQFQQGKYEHKKKFSHWLSSITHNVTVSYFREQRRKKMYFETLPKNYVFADIEEVSCVAEDENTYLNKRLADYLMCLPCEQAEVVLLKCIHDKSFREISEIMSTSINTTMGRYRYGLKKMRRLLEEDSSL